MKKNNRRYLASSLVPVLAAGALVAAGILPVPGAVAAKATVAGVLATTPATATDLTPNGVAVDSNGNVYISDTANHVVDEVSPSGALSVVAGVPGQGGPPTAGPATSSDLAAPAGLAVDGAGDLYIADSGENGVVEEVTPSGNLSVVAGDAGQFGAPVPGPATSSDLLGPIGVALDSAGDIYVADSLHGVVEEVTPALSQTAGTLSIVAGTSDTFGPPSCTSTFQCTPVAATSSHLFVPGGVAVDASGDIFIADTGNHVVEEVNAQTGLLSIVAGVPDQSGPPTPGPGEALNSHPVFNSELGDPIGLALDGKGDLYIADSSNNVVEEVNLASGALSVVAGVPGQSGPPTPGPATSSDLNGPEGVAVDASGNLFIADTGSNVVEKVTPAGTLSIFAGTGTGVPCPFASPLTTTVNGDQTIPQFAVCTIGGGGDIAGNVTVDGGTLELQSGGTVGGGVTVDNGSAEHGVLATFGGTVHGDVSSLGSLTLGAGTTVTGNVGSGGGTLVDNGASVGGGIQVDKASSVSITGGATVAGNVQIQGTTSVPAPSGGPGSGTDLICNAQIGGNLQVQDNGSAAPFQVADCTRGLIVGGNLQVQGNAGAQVIGGSYGSTVKGDIQVTGNTGGGQMADNSAGGDCVLQGNEPPFTSVPDNTAGLGKQDGCNVTPGSIVVDVSATQTYGSSPQFTYTDDASSGITVSGTVSCTTVAGGTQIAPALAAGSYAVDPSSCGGLTSSPSEYPISYQGSLTVSPAALTVTASTLSTVYGSTMPTVTPSYKGFVNSDTPSSLSAQPMCSAPATPQSPPGVYPTSCSGAANPNYNIGYVDGTMTITPAPLAVAGAPVSLLESFRQHKVTFQVHVTNAATGSPAVGVKVTVSVQIPSLFGPSFSLRNRPHVLLQCTATSSASGLATCSLPGRDAFFLLFASHYNIAVASMDYMAATGTGTIVLR